MSSCVGPLVFICVQDSWYVGETLEVYCEFCWSLDVILCSSLVGMFRRASEFIARFVSDLEFYLLPFSWISGSAW